MAGTTIAEYSAQRSKFGGKGRHWHIHLSDELWLWRGTACFFLCCLPLTEDPAVQAKLKTSKPAAQLQLKASKPMAQDPPLELKQKVNKPMAQLLQKASLRPSEGRRQVSYVTGACAEVHLEHLGEFLVSRYALEHSVHGHGRRVPEPIILYDNILNLPVARHTRRQASCCRRLKDFGRHAMISESRTASPTQPAGFSDYIKDSLCFVF